MVYDNMNKYTDEHGDLFLVGDDGVDKDDAPIATPSKPSVLARAKGMAKTHFANALGMARNISVFTRRLMHREP